MDVATRRCRERVIRNRAQERVAQCDPVAVDGHEPGVFGRRERIGLEAERRERGERLPQARIAGGDDTDRQPGRLRELRESGLERVPHARTDRQRLHLAGVGHGTGDLRELEQGERVARAGAHQVVGGAARQPAAMREQMRARRCRRAR